MGRNLFRARCTSCHGLDAKGGEEGDGPDLTTGRFRNATTDAGLFRVIHDGIEGTSMRGLRREDEQSIWQLVTYLRSLAPVAAADLPGSPVAGARLFEAQECSSCHRVAGRGGRLGPDLSTVAARRRPDEMRLALVDPGAEVEPRWWMVEVTGRDGSTVRGLRMGEDTFTLRIMDLDENLHAYAKSAVSWRRSPTSVMPSFAELKEEELDDLVAYLGSLRSEAP